MPAAPNFAKTPSRDQREHAMARTTDHGAVDAFYNPKYTVCDPEPHVPDISRHVPRRFDASAGYRQPVGANLTYQTDHCHDFLAPHTHGAVAFAPRTLPIMRRAASAMGGASGAAGSPQPSSSISGATAAANGRLTPQMFYAATRETVLQHKTAGSEVDALCGSFESVQRAIEIKYPNRIPDYRMDKDASREQRTRTGYFSLATRAVQKATANMPALRVNYGAVGGRGFRSLLPIGEDPKTKISFGKAVRMPVDKKDQLIAARAAASGNSEATGDSLAAFNATRRTIARGAPFAKPREPSAAAASVHTPSSSPTRLRSVSAGNAAAFK